VYEYGDLRADEVTPAGKNSTVEVSAGEQPSGSRWALEKTGSLNSKPKLRALRMRCNPQNFWLLAAAHLSLCVQSSCAPQEATQVQFRGSDSSPSGLAINVGENVCFNEPVNLLDEILGEGTTDIDAVVINAIMASQEAGTCSAELASALENSSFDIALSDHRENSFGLISKTAVLKKISGLLGIRRLDDLPNMLSSLRIRLSSGFNVLVNIVRTNSTGLINSSLRGKLRPESTKFVKYNGPRFVQAQVYDPTRFKILTNSLEVHRKDFLAKFERWLASMETEKFIINPDHFSVASRDPVLTAGVREVFKVVSSPRNVFRHLQNLEMDIAKRMASKGETMEVALEALLTAQEKKHAFQSAFDLTGDLTRDHLRRPALFRDAAFGHGGLHGRQIHRIQWNVVTRHLEETALKERIKGAELYTLFGEGVTLKKGTGSWADGWNALFDGFGSNLGSPERWRLWLTDFLPTLAGWP
jgi:hypothetical protein